MKIVVLIEILFFIGIIIGYVFFKRWRYIPFKKVKGTCIKNEMKISKMHIEYRDGHIDNRLYIPIIQYTYNGETYVAKSIIAYRTPKYYNGDKVNVLINRKNKEIVRIIGKIKNNF